MEDKIIIKHIKKKNELGIEMLIDTYGGLIKGIIRMKLYDGSLEDECINDVLMCIWNSINTYEEGKGNFKNWITSVTRYKIIDYNRKYLRNLQKVSYIDSESFSQIKDEKEEIDREIIKKEIREEIEDLLSNLKDRDKQLFIKHYLEGAGIESLQEELGIKSEVIYNRLSRGRSKLRKILESGILKGGI